MDLLNIARSNKYLVGLNRIIGDNIPQILPLLLGIYRRHEKKYAAFRLETLRKNWSIPVSNNIHFTPTYRCNVRCDFCYQRNFTEQDGHSELSSDQALVIFKELNPRWIKLIGGEIFLKKDIMDLVDGLGNQGVRVSFSSNGTLIDQEKVKRLGQNKQISEMGISLYSPSHLGTGVWEKQSIRCLAKRFPILGKIHLTANGELTAGEAVKLMASMGVKRILALFENAVSQEQNEESMELLEREMGWKPEEQNLHTALQTFNQSYSSVIRAVQSAQETARLQKVALFFNIPVSSRMIVGYLAGKCRNDRFTCARLALPRLFIAPDGSVNFCEFIRHSFGGLAGNQEPNDIVNGPEMKEFRRFLDQNGLLPICERCCNLLSLD